MNIVPALVYINRLAHMNGITRYNITQRAGAHK